MVLILLSWLYILFTSIGIGVGFSRLFQLQPLSIVSNCILGLFGITLLASAWAIFGPINLEFHIFLLIASIILTIYYKSDFKVVLNAAWSQLLSLPLVLKVLFSLSSILILAQSATLPFIVDNETYYIQTIKWLNEFGFVPGLANLHLFLGQTSGWHIIQSVYSFSFLYEDINDLNGFLLVLSNFWVFQKLQAYFTGGNRQDLIFGLVPLAYVFLFQFVSAPSPDLPVYLLSFIVFSLYLELHRDFVADKFSLLTIFILFAVYIKITAVVLLILPLILLIKVPALVKSQLVKLQLLGGLVVFLLATKNIILTGYPFYPLTVLPYSSADYVVPIGVMDYFFGKEMMHSFYMGFGAFQDASGFYLLQQYFLHSGIDSIIGWTTLLLLAISPVIISKYFQKQRLNDIYFVMVTLLLLLVFSSPQYRFYVYFTIFFGLVFLSMLLTQKKLIIGLFGLSFLLVSVLVFVPISFSVLTQNKLMVESNTFELENLIHPKPSTKEKMEYTEVSKGNLNYNSPTNETLFWITGNGNLPTVNEEQLRYFETNFHVIPQLRGDTLGDGFYAKKVKTND